MIKLRPVAFQRIMPNNPSDLSLFPPFLLPQDLAGERVDKALAQCLPDYSRAQLSEWLKQGYILLNDLQVKPKYKILGGETIHILPSVQSLLPPLSPKAEDLPLDLIFEDEDLLVVNKPAHLVVHPAPGNPEHTLVNALLHHFPNNAFLPRAGLIHRLDKDTTGLMIVAKSALAYTKLVHAMQARDIQRRYTALVYGRTLSHDHIETFYGRDPKNRLKMAIRPSGKIAITDYTTEKYYQGLSLVQVKLLTGRTHQIRVHLAFKLFPLVGDPLYGKKNPPYALFTPACQSALAQFKRQALHAFRLSFDHPRLEIPLDFQAPLPQDFKDLLLLLDKENEHV